MPADNSIYFEISDAIKQIDPQIDLTNCDREPIHTPNLIQPHGLLLAVSTVEYCILQVSLNTKQMLGIEPEALLNQPLSQLLGTKQVVEIENCLRGDFDAINPMTIEIQLEDKILLFQGIVHLHQEIIILELEPEQKERSKNFFDFYRLVKRPIDKLRSTANLEDFCQVIVSQVKRITQFDRVMVYRFHADGAGEVIAEAVEAELTPYLGLHYPATDIPRSARDLFALKTIRLIPDVAYEPVGIIPKLNPVTQELLDLSKASLRSVSPFHVEYLHNMGVRATLVISLVKDQKLWGLISCHHQTPKKLPYETLTICEFIGQIASFELTAKEANLDLDYKVQLKSIQSQLTEAIAAAENINQFFQQNSQRLLDLVDGTGLALAFGDDLTLLGDTPDQKFVLDLLPWLENQFAAESVYATHSLSQVYPAGKEHQTQASGLLALSISRVQKTFIIWFRPESTQAVNWAGNPHQPMTRDEAGTILLSPRTSFALWQETVRGKSLPWKTCEVETALELRSSIVSIALRRAEKLSQINQELTRSNTELDAFAYIASHDLKEPLRGICNYSNFLLEDYSDILDEAGIDKLNTLMRLTNRMEDLINSLLHYSRLGRAELRLSPTNLNDVVKEVLEVTKASARDTKVEFRIPRSLPIISCDRIQVSELFTNLVSNGIKYNQKANKIIEIGYLDEDDPISLHKMSEYPGNTPTKTILYVRDNGIGIRDKHIESIFRIFKRLHGQKKYGGGTGAGLTIAQKIADRHGGSIWVSSTYQEGSTFYFTLQ